MLTSSVMVVRNANWIATVNDKLTIPTKKDIWLKAKKTHIIAAEDKMALYPHKPS